MPRFEIFADRAGQYRWRFKAANGEIVATSEAYASKQHAVRGAETVKRLATQALILDAVTARWF